MPVKELQLETGGAADLLIQETGDSNDTILLEDSTSPTTQTVGMRAYATGSELRATILGRQAKVNATSKGKDDRVTILGRLGAVRDISLGSKVGVRIVCGIESGRSRSLGAENGASKKSGVAKACGETTGAKSSAEFVSALAKTRANVNSYTRRSIVSEIQSATMSRLLGGSFPSRLGIS